MLRTPTHFVEIGTNTTKTSTPLIEKLQHHHHQHHTTAPGTKYHYHEQYTKTTTADIVDNSKQQQQVHQSTTTKIEYHLQTKKQLQTSKNINKLKKKNKSSSSSSTSTSISSNSSVSSNDSSSTQTTTATSAATTITSTPPPALTFKEHLLSRGLLSGSPFAFMRLKKAKTVAVATKATELRKSSKRLVDYVDSGCNNNLSGSNKKKLNKTGASITTPTSAITLTSTSLSPTSATTPETKSTRTTGYFANILSSSSSNTSSNSNNSSTSSTTNNTKNVYNNNNNNNYLTSYTTATSDQSVVANSTSPPSTILPFVSFANTVVAPPTLVAVAVASPPIANNTTTTTTAMSPTSQTPPSVRTSLFDSCHRKIRLIGGGPVAFLGGLVAKARRKERDGDQNSTDTKLYLEESVLERKLPEADLKALVDLPAGLDYNEWLASHTLALFEHVNLVYGTISEFCTTSGCPDMTGPANRTYLWFDEKGKKTRVAAPQYIDYVMTFTQKTVSDESIFPTKYANEFPSSFESIARKILRLQFHVIAHLYAAHFREIALLGLHTHLNLTFAHLTALHRRFNLIDEKETDVLRDLEVALRLTDDTSNSTCGGGGVGGGSQNESGDTTMSSATAGESGRHGGEDVNSVQHNNTTPPSLIDGGPICTQPEAGTKSQQFGVGGGGGLIGGILGDLSSGEFGDTMHYCTSAVPASSNTCSATNPLQNTTPSTCNSMNGTCNAFDQQQHATAIGGGVGGAVTANGNNGAGAFHQQHNNNNHVTQHHHHHHPHHHHAVHHHHHHPNHYAQNTGLIQCNASNAPTAATTSTTTA